MCRYFICIFFMVLWGHKVIADTMFIGDKKDLTMPKMSRDGREKDIWEAGLIAPIDVPKVSIYDKDGGTVLLKDFKGNTVIVIFWASWCLQCVEELISVDNLMKELDYNEVKNVKLIPISIDFKAQDVQEGILKSDNISVSSYYDKAKELMNSLGVNSLPTSFVINSESKIVLRIQQHLDWNNPYIYKKVVSLSNTPE